MRNKDFVVASIGLVLFIFGGCVLDSGGVVAWFGTGAIIIGLGMLYLISRRFPRYER